jgi:hypothetical protein
MSTAAQPILLDDSDSDVIEILVITIDDKDAAAEELVPDRVDKTIFRPAPADPTNNPNRQILYEEDMYASSVRAKSTRWRTFAQK